MSINWAQIEMLTQLEDASDGSLLGEMLQLYERQVPELSEKIVIAIQSGQYVEASEFAHKLKSSAANLGFSEVEARCLTIEREARRRSPLDYQKLVDEIRSFSLQGLLEIKKFLATKESVNQSAA